MLAAPAFAQSDDVDPELRIQQLENQLRQLTGQNEELQYRNRQLEDRLRLLQGNAQGAPAAIQPNVAAAPPVQSNPSFRQPPAQPGAESQIAAPAPIVQEQPGVPQPQGRRRGDAFDPGQNPNAPGAPQALGGGQLPIPTEAPIGAPGGRAAG
ncbi:MAG TPA: tol-pal system protein YbgF, partial [Bradyrhizobium sp.]|nr:tol-pal system protein YbgF [Bradyrhizobium sp.]